MAQEANPFAALDAMLGGDAAPSQADGCRIGVVLTIDPSEDDPAVGTLLTASVGSLPLDGEDIVFLRHTNAPIAVGERMLLVSKDDGQTFYCIGRF